MQLIAPKKLSTEKKGCVYNTKFSLLFIKELHRVNALFSFAMELMYEKLEFKKN